MQTHQCWSSPMWGHQIVSLMTKRWDVEIPPEPRDMTVSLAAANAKKAELAKAVHDKAYRYLMNGPASAQFISKAIHRDLGWTRKILAEMYTARKITFDKRGHTKVWRIA